MIVAARSAPGVAVACPGRGASRTRAACAVARGRAGRPASLPHAAAGLVQLQGAPSRPLRPSLRHAGSKRSLLRAAAGGAGAQARGRAPAQPLLALPLLLL